MTSHSNKIPPLGELHAFVMKCYEEWYAKNPLDISTEVQHDGLGGFQATTTISGRSVPHELLDQIAATALTREIAYGEYMSIVRSPQAPEDIKPVPWQKRPLSDVGFPPKAVDYMREAHGVTNLGTLSTMGPDFVVTECPGVGPSTAAKIEQAIAAYQEGA